MFNWEVFTEEMPDGTWRVGFKLLSPIIEHSTLTKESYAELSMRDRMNLNTLYVYRDGFSFRIDPHSSEHVVDTNYLSICPRGDCDNKCVYKYYQIKGSATRLKRRIENILHNTYLIERVESRYPLSTTEVMVPNFFD